MVPVLPHPPKPLRNFFAGAGFLFRGFRVWLSAPRLMLLGMLPAAIAGFAVLALLIVLFVNIEAVATFITPFASGWEDLPRGGIRFVAGVAVILASILIVVNTYTTVTLMVGDNFYRRIASHVDSIHGAPPTPPQLGFWSDVRRGLGEGLRLFFPTVGLALLVFVIGFIPLAGPLLAATAGALLGGWLLIIELVNIPCEARGIYLSQRKRMLRESRATALGLGAATYLVFLIPFGAIFAMPAALAGSTLLTRSLLGEVLIPRPGKNSRSAGTTPKPAE